MCTDRDCGHCIPGTNVPAGAGAAGGAAKDIGLSAVAWFGIACLGIVVGAVWGYILLALGIAAGLFLIGFAVTAVVVLRNHARPRGGIQWGTSAIANDIRASVDQAFAEELERTRTLRQILARQQRVTVTAEQLAAIERR